ncbi:MAG: FmdB family zinc ribbon protein [Solidesulfovibrio sp.]|uniref:FmdB family zinc ribbon protein n=1 Tax=Solidesulfovibrio sp. TaxID=2910990 RepID=UPI002B212207|nr:FmdB family zinc ribbon protein [Solidesulfovibrio sp.]MEA4856352.1 FmdB family zinc ribbon protein [Solidesulfovibrio sp.]
MPIYEYQCDKCGKISEVLQKSFDVDEAPCEACGATARRIMSNTSFVLKGTGWYVTDYKANGGCSASGGNGSGKSESDKPAAAADSSSSPAPSCDKAPSAGCGGCAKAAAPAASSSATTAS